MENVQKFDEDKVDTNDENKMTDKQIEQRYEMWIYNYKMKNELAQQVNKNLVSDELTTSIMNEINTRAPETKDEIEV